MSLSATHAEAAARNVAIRGELLGDAVLAVEEHLLVRLRVK
jgi:hypothetical protein